MRRAGPKIAISLALVAVTVAVYAPSLDYGLTNFDDPSYAANRQVRAGITAAGLRWAATTFHESNWHPLTWISLMLDAEIGRGNPRMFHRTNLVLHAANAVLLFVLLVRLTGELWKAAAVAALFALHPLHVESVAWVSERKDVLSTVFWLGATLAYARWVERPGGVRYAGLTALFAAGLMSKPMLVTLPLTLLLLDRWPLRREEPIGRRVAEKLPLFAMAAASSVVTLVAQERGGSLQDLARYPLPARIANAIVAWAAYLGKAVWPVDLAVFYPHPGASIAPVRVAVAALALAAVTAAGLLSSRRAPHLRTGWLFYVVTLVPVIGIVQVGPQAMADRYTYVPLIGVFIAAVWGLDDLARRFGGRTAERALATAACAVVVALGVAARAQLGHWKDSIALFSRAIEVASPNALAHNNLGSALSEQRRHDEAIEHFRAALGIDPDYADAAGNLAGALIKTGRPAEAEALCRDTLARHPANARSRTNLGMALIALGRREEAVEPLRAAVEARPDHAVSRAALGLALLLVGRTEEAFEHLGRAARLEPDFADARLYLGIALLERGDPSGAIEHLEAAVRLDPGNALAAQQLERARESARPPSR